jgi:hypothetical protein
VPDGNDAPEARYVERDSKLPAALIRPSTVLDDARHSSIETPSVKAAGSFLLQRPLADDGGRHQAWKQRHHQLAPARITIAAKENPRPASCQFFPAWSFYSPAVKVVVSERACPFLPSHHSALTDFARAPGVEVAT